MKRTRYAVLALLLLVSSAMLLRASLPQVATGTWHGGAAMTEARTGAATASLPGGQVLMTGGTTAGGGITNSAEVFDPAANSWSGLAAVMQDPRSGHTASVLADGRVLLAGGENSGGVIGTIEIYDPASESFSSVGTLMQARKNHGAAVLKDGRVWLVGGTDGATALASSEIYDPADGAITAGPSLPAPRTGLTATALLDGTVLIAGGSNDEGDLASTLIYDATAGTMTAGASLSVARSGHTAILLPNNNEVLIAGGSAAGSDLASAELYVPWTGAVEATAAMSAARAGAAGGGFKDYDGRVMVAGGSGSASSEYYGFATVKTDADDYAPGTIVFITGSGWQPGETVTLVLHEDVDPPAHADRTLTAVADALGEIFNNEFVPEEHDLGVRFYLTATGASSQAQTTFTDHTPHGTRNFNFSTTGLGVATSITISGSRNNPGSGHAFASYSTTFTSPGPSSNVGAAITIASGVNALASSLTFAGFPASVSGVGGTYNLTGVSHTSPISVPTTTGTTSVVATYAFVPSDSTPPVITPNVVGTLGSNGWYTSNVDVSWTVTDAESTITSTTGCGASSVTTDTAGVTFTCSATSAGGTNSNSVTIKRDATAPSVSATPSPAANANGWNNTDVTVSYSCTDATSGVDAGASDLGDDVLSASGTASGSCVDNAGNSASADYTAQIDKVKPVITGSRTPAANGFGWNNTDVTVSFSCTDSGGSGLDTNTVAGATVSTEGAGQSVTNTGSCSDKAGNTADAATVSDINIDKTAPTAEVTPDRAADHNTWYNHTLTFSTSGSSDALSGIDSCTAVAAYSGPDTASASVSTTCTDKAGNSAGGSFNFKYDGTAPTGVSGAPNRAADHNGWYNHAVDVVFTGTDATSGIDSCSTVNYSGPDSSTASANGSCTDNAGNTSAPVASSSFQYDGTAPSASIAVSAGTAGSNGWYTSDVTVHTSGTDATSGIDSCTADQFQTTETAGQGFTGNCTDNAGNTSTDASLTVKLDKTPPVVSLTPSGTLGTNGWYISDVTIHTSGTETISTPINCSVDQSQTTDTTGATFNGSCTNDAGLTGHADPLTVKRDATAPTGVSGAPNRAPDHNGWYNHAVDVVFTGTDATSGIDSCSTANYSGPDSSTASANGSCTDNAGNTSAPVASSSFQYDGTAPSASIAVSAGTAGSNGWYISDVTVHTSGTDATSGIDTCTADQFQTTETAGQGFTGNCTDNAGNTSTDASLTVKLDKTGPSASLSVTSGTLGLNGWYVTNVTVSTSGSDSISNPTSCSADQFQTTDTTGTPFNGSCTNDAGLTTHAAPLTVKRDATPPSITITTPANTSYVLNALVASNYSCSDATSGVASCSGPVANGANFSTNPVGPHTFTVNAADQAGNTATPVTNDYSVIYAVGGSCLGSPGHQILQPINADGTSVNKQGSTVPAKFRVCDANGVSIGTPGVVTDFRLVGIVSGTVTNVDEAVDSTTPDNAFRWSATDQQWIFNISTKHSPFSKNKTYMFLITLNDGSTIAFQFGLK